jgi:hypothetical protein
MSDAVVFADPRRAVRDLLTALLEPRLEPYVLGVRVSAKPLPGADEARALPYVQVRSDGRFRDSRLDGRATVRLLVWHEDEGAGEDLAALCEALLLSSSSASVRGCTPGTGPLPSVDPATDAPLSSLTLTVRLHPADV